MKFLFACLVSVLAFSSVSFAEGKVRRILSSTSHVCYEASMITYNGESSVATFSRGEKAIDVKLTGPRQLEGAQLALTNGLQVCFSGSDTSSFIVMSKNTTLE
jgi:hypothetical protein